MKGKRSEQWSDVGVTLVELLVASSIAALVMPVLGAAMVIGWRTTDDTVASISDTRDRQIVTSLLVGDVQGATTVDVNGADGCPLGGGTLVVRLSRQETSPAGAVTKRAAVWVTRTTVDGERQLERRECDDSSGSMLVVGQVTTAHGVVGSPTVGCKDTTGLGVTCASTSSVATVDLGVTDAAGPFTVTGRRRTAP